MRRRLERSEEQRLAPYATRSASATRRLPLEDAGRTFDYRTAFQRDRDRIVYSRAFRRLRQKAQSGILPAYEDHRRNRLTHTLEVSQIARTIARALSLNEDLVEAIALGHDLGQPPFGAAGEGALDDLLGGRLDGRVGPGLGDLGGFWRSWQSLRVVDRLEKRYDHAGLNLTDAVREGIAKAAAPEGRLPAEPVEGFDPQGPCHPEGQVVALADRIATAVGELDDALQSGAVPVAQVERLGGVRELRRKLGRAYPSDGSSFTRGNAIHRGLTHLLVTGAIVRGPAAGPSVTVPAAGQEVLAELEGFLRSRVSRRAAADRVHARGRHALLGLFAAYQADPLLLDDHVLLRFKESAGVRYLRDVPRDRVEAEVAARYRADGRWARTLADHLASMTDVYALEEHARLLAMGAIPIPSAEQLRREGRQR